MRWHTVDGTLRAKILMKMRRRNRYDLVRMLASNSSTQVGVLRAMYVKEKKNYATEFSYAF